MCIRPEECNYRKGMEEKGERLYQLAGDESQQMTSSSKEQHPAHEVEADGGGGRRGGIKGRLYTS